MPARAPAKRPAKAAARKAAARKAPAKAASRPAKPPAKPRAPRKVAARKAPAPAKPGAQKPRGRAPGPPVPAVARPGGEPDWLPAETGWAPAPEPSWEPAPAAAAPQFDPATGEWLPAAPATAAAAPPAPDPAAYRAGATRSILLNVLLGIDLGLVGVAILFGIAQFIALVFYPDSGFSQDLRDTGAGSPAWLVVNMLLNFVLFGAVPFLWVLGTRWKPWEGTKKYLQLRAKPKDIGLGVLLVPVMFIALILLSVAYVCATEGCQALTQEEDTETEQTGVDPITGNLTWPIAVLVAVTAGVGEEILFRGVLRRYIGNWGQAIVFALGHAGNGFPPQVLLTFGIGLFFGWLAKRNWSLVSLMVAHALYDFALLSLALLYPDLG